MFFRPPTKPVHKTPSADNEDLDSVQQDERGGTITVDFVTGDDDPATVESVHSSVPGTPVVNNNQGQSKYGRTYRRTMHYDPVTGCMIDAEATALANYYQCFKDTDGKMEFANVGDGIFLLGRLILNILSICTFCFPKILYQFLTYIIM
jgi:hypothetical protein